MLVSISKLLLQQDGRQCLSFSLNALGRDHMVQRLAVALMEAAEDTWRSPIEPSQWEIDPLFRV